MAANERHVNVICAKNNEENKKLLFESLMQNKSNDIIQSLVTPVSVDYVDKNGMTPLHLLLIYGKNELVRVFLENGADVNAFCNEKQMTVLHRAVLSEHVSEDVISQLISPQNIDMKDIHGRTPLHLAASHKRWNLIRIFIQHGADVNLCNNDGESILFQAMYYDVPLKTVLLLVTDENVNIAGPQGFTPLHKMVQEERWDAVKVFLDHKADINQCSVFHTTPLHEALFHEDVPFDIIEQLISTENIQIKDKLFGNLPLTYAVGRNGWRMEPFMYPKMKADFSVIHCMHIKSKHIELDSLSRILQIFKPPESLEFTFTTEAGENLVDCKNLISLSYLVHVTSSIKPKFLQIPADEEFYPLLKQIIKFQQPDDLKKLCMITIRSSVDDWSDASLSCLGLPHALTEYVKLKTIAKQVLDKMKCTNQYPDLRFEISCKE